MTRLSLVAVACVSAALLMTELALTRIFSVVMYYHFAFLAISIALFGLSASGVFAYRAARTARSRADRTRCSAIAVARLRRVHVVALFVLVRLRVGLNYSPREPRADADDLRARGAAVLHRRPRHHARDLAVVLAHQRGLRRRSARRRRRLPGADSAARSARRARASCWRPPRWPRWRRSSSRRPAGAPATPRPAPRFLAVPLAGQLVGPRRLRRRRHQGPRGRPRALQQVEFVLAHRRLRARARRLVAQPRLHRAAAGDAIHGHRLGGVHADPARRARPVERPVPALRADRAGLSPEGQGAGSEAGDRAGSGGAGTGVRRQASRRSSSAPAAGAISSPRWSSARPRRRRRDQSDHRQRRDARSVPRLLRRHLHAPARAHRRGRRPELRAPDAGRATTSSRRRSSTRGPPRRPAPTR